MRRVLLVSPHPDDESIGCGGTLRRHVLAGDEVRLIFLTSGEWGGWAESPEELARRREQEAATAAEILGISHVEFWREPDGMLQATDTLVGRLADAMTDWDPTIVYAPHAQEDSPDHQAAARAVRRARRRLDGRGASCFFFEIWTPIRRFDQIVDISEVLNTKLDAIRAHRSQCELMRFDDAALGLARYRGEMHSWPGGDYAEVFSVEGENIELFEREEQGE